MFSLEKFRIFQLQASDAGHSLQKTSTLDRREKFHRAENWPNESETFRKYFDVLHQPTAPRQIIQLRTSRIKISKSD